jgi:hypothetical protein
MNNARRILSKGSTLLRGCWVWSKKLHFQKNFGRNFIAVEGVTLRREQDVLAIGRSLRAWPLPKLIVNRYPLTNEHASPWEEMFNWNFRDYQQKLTLPPEAVQWEDATILEYWQIQQHKVMAFACGLHNRLGAVSQVPVSSIDESMLMHITNELLGGWSLMQQWQREQMAQKTVTAS